MSARNVLALAAACIVGAGVVSGCASNAWKVKMNAGEAAWLHNPPQLSVAEENFKAAIALASKDAVPEPYYHRAISGLGEVLSQEGRYADAQEHLLHAVSLATATDMSVVENVRLLKLLEQAYENNRNYQQAAETQTVLVNYVAGQLSPLASDYKAAALKRDQLKALVAANCTKGDACCEARKEVAEADRAAQAKKAVAAQPAVAPGAD